MYVKAFAALLFIAPVLATPVATATAESWSDSTDSDLSDYADSLTVPSVPNSILTVLETAIPASWYADIMDPSSRSAIMSEIEAGTLPAWYNALPSSVKAWASAQGGFDDNFIGVTDADSGSGEATAIEPQSTPTTTALNVAVTNTAAASMTSEAVSSGVVSSSGAVSTSQASSTGSSQSSSHASSSSATPSSATSTGGAPVPTTGVAMTIAGIAGLLGLAIAL